MFLDLSKAFNSIPHTLLVKKLTTFGITGYLLHWMTDYLTNRNEAVICEGAKSQTKPVISGVSQGSILGPLLISMYINDLPDVTDVDTYLYADDTKIMYPIRTLNDCEVLQNSLDNIVNWSTKWGLKFNPDKCKSVSFNRKRTILSHAYVMSNIVIERLQSLSDLGLTVDSRLNWNDHVINITNKANQRLGLHVVKRILGYNINQGIKLEAIHRREVQELLKL